MFELRATNTASGASPEPAPGSRPQAVLVKTIRLYQRFLSPVTGNSCRFHPSCSHYALAAICTHGCGWGLWLTGKRLLRCNPLFEGGNDPVPTSVSLFAQK